MIRSCLRCGRVLKTYFAVDEAVGRCDLWCPDCGTGHKTEHSELVAVMNHKDYVPKRWNHIPPGALAVMEWIPE